MVAKRINKTVTVVLIGLASLVNNKTVYRDVVCYCCQENILSLYIGPTLRVHCGIYLDIIMDVIFTRFMELKLALLMLITVSTRFAC
jgi:hydrogenase-4 membrane subunit HyfE